MEAFLFVAVYLLQPLVSHVSGVCKCLLKTVVYTTNFVTGHIQS